MGLFDSVWVNCPMCGTANEFQSKSGDCYLSNYTLEHCPKNVLMDINRHAPIICTNCKSPYEVDIEAKKSVWSNRAIIIKKHTK